MTFHFPALPVRIAIGVCIFIALALHDLHRHGRRATRWREYAVLLVCVAAACAYGALNDQVTSSISWEYFYYGKDLAETLGPRTPPDPLQLHLRAALVGVQATWSAGLILGVALLVANNPTKRLPQLPYPTLLRQLPVVLLITLVASALGGFLGHRGLLNWLDDEFPALFRTDTWRPRRFLTVYGIHLGAYAGGVLGTVVAVVRIRRARARFTGTIFDAASAEQTVQSRP